MKKQCTKCKEWKLLSAFHKSPAAKNGLNSHCKQCRSNYYKKYQQTDKAKRLKKENDKRYYQAHKIEINRRKKNYQKQYRKTLTGYLRRLFLEIRQRCNNQKDTGYHNYGGRGIKCLFESANEFVNYVINELKVDPRGLEIDRINNNGHYEKGNIRFVTRSENCKNRRKKHE